MLNAESLLDLPERPAAQAGAPVAAWAQPMTIDTYLPADPDRYPAYLDRRVYQGSSGRVYPLPFYDRIRAEKVPVVWDAVHLENPWVRLVILPQLGGRVHVARERSTGYDFFYANPVIKPALVGLTGPWLAGGVEFNWPQHHRPGTFLPMDVELEHEADGAVTVWCSDHDPFARMKGMHGLRLRPDSTVVELRVRLYNRSELTQTFLWWANVAARVDDDYESFFPRDVRVVADHAKRAVTAFPRADRPYYGIDYPARADRASLASDGTPVTGDLLGWFRNIPVPTSYMCLGSDEDFFGGYDHARRAGFVHVADHHLSGGKKQWTWGSSAFGDAWHRNLADDGAAYVELMAGVFTDNQPDFSYLAPGETKVFSQYWYPIRELGPVDRANVDAAVRLQVDTAAGVARVGVLATSARAGAQIEVLAPGGRPLYGLRVDLHAGEPHLLDVPLAAGALAEPGLTVRVLHEGAELVAWTTTAELGALPDVEPAREPAAPDRVDSVEELAAIAEHLELYRHATRSPEPYWREALRRDPGHAASLVGLGQRAYRRGDLAAATDLFNRAVARLTALHPNASDTSASYLLGLVHERAGRPAQALVAYGRASWTRQWRAPAGYRMARLDAAAGRDRSALARLDDVLRAEPEHLQGLALRVVVLRRLGRLDAAQDELRRARALDRLDAWLRDLDGLDPSADAQIVLDVALEQAGIGELDAAGRLLDRALEREAHRPSGQAAAGALISYHRADLLRRSGRPARAERAADVGQGADATHCFPGRLDDALALDREAAHRPDDFRLHALLGHWLYSVGRHGDALDRWRRSAALHADDPVVWRNIGLASHDHGDGPEAARDAYDRALAVAPRDARLRYESDQLDERRGLSVAARLDTLLAHSDLVAQRHDASVQLANLLVSADREGEARDLLAGRTFQPWEGGEGQVLRAWERAGTRLAVHALGAGEPVVAARHLLAALEPPASLGEARHPLASTANLHLLLGDALALTGRDDEARAAWEAAAASGDFQVMRAEEHSEATFWGVLALHRLGAHDRAGERTARLRAFAAELGTTGAVVDYFATSLPDLLLFAQDPDVARGRRARFVRAQLAVLDGDEGLAGELLDALLVDCPHHLDALDLQFLLAQPVALLTAGVGA